LGRPPPATLQNDKVLNLWDLLVAKTGNKGKKKWLTVNRRGKERDPKHNHGFVEIENVNESRKGNNEERGENLFWKGGGKTEEGGPVGGTKG